MFCVKQSISFRPLRLLQSVGEIIRASRFCDLIINPFQLFYVLFQCADPLYSYKPNACKMSGQYDIIGNQQTSRDVDRNRSDWAVRFEFITQLLCKLLLHTFQVVYLITRKLY